MGSRKGGAKNRKTILSESEVLDIRRLRVAGVRGTAVAEMFGISTYLVCAIHKRKSWAWLAGSVGVADESIEE